MSRSIHLNMSSTKVMEISFRAQLDRPDSDLSDLAYTFLNVTKLGRSRKANEATCVFILYPEYRSASPSST